MKYLLLALFSMHSMAHAASLDLSGPEAFALFHRMVFELKVDSQKWLAKSRDELAKVRKNSVSGKNCQRKNDEAICQQAIKEVLYFSVLPVRDPFIFQLDKDLKTKYSFDVETGMRIFQLSTALRWIAREDIYNGVPAPKKATARSYAQFLKQIHAFHENKALEIRKAAPMIPPPSRR
ncbi:hypothetical protein [Bdellovibrio sp. HCB2-146]|uniref:hypothetical protein n=1 Tax=Bdellovibrio sp. HCB2-146 TaxID=3394362 RepID=UPI0039BC995B